jgi:hypothetical protein
MKSFYRFAVLAFFSLIVLTSSDVFADSYIFSVSLNYEGLTSHNNYCGDGRYIVTSTDVFAAGGSDNGGIFELVADCAGERNLYEAIVYVNDVQVLNCTFYSGDYIGQYFTAKAGDEVRIVLAFSNKVTNQFAPFPPASATFGFMPA